MKLHSFVLLSLFLACNSTQKPLARNQDPQAVNTAIDPLPFSRTITAEELKEHLYTYASDEFEGRETGQPGQKKAANYLKKAYQKLGIPAARGGDDYFQDVPLEIGQIPSGSIFVNGTEYPLGDDVLSFSAAEGDYSEVVYLGYGIDTKVYSDYNRVDVQDKLVLVKAGEPRNADGSFVVSGTSEKSVWSNPSEAFGKRLKAASKHGAKGMLYYDQNNFNRFK
ncbi:MAG: peptidase, partial [Bacteroidota bacterium]